MIIIISSNAIGQIKSDDLFCDTCMVKVPYKYLKKMRLLTVEYDFMKIEIDSLYKRENLYKQVISGDNLIIAMKDTVIAIKERQLIKFEQTSQITQVIKKTGFLTWVGVIVSSLVGGLVIGYVLK